jgi:predicted nucleic acid-binding protein
MARLSMPAPEPAFLLDSVILIDHCNNIEAATRFLSENFARSAISPITRAEVLAGFENPADFAQARQLLDQFRFLPMDAAVADEATRQRQHTRLKLPDAIQSAFARCHALRLVTRNSKDFKHDPTALFPYTLDV